MEVAPDVLHYRTLKFMVQPFVENAVFHAFTSQDRHYELNIRVEKTEDNDIQFIIRDNGIGIGQERLNELLEQEWSDNQTINSIGIGNVSRRLKLHYGEKYGVVIDSTEGLGTTVCIRIPAMEQNPVPQAPRKEEAV
jgi:two-component system sensor histidine kinase YesM